MDALQVLVLATLQGLTEFLPISSSAHLVLVPVYLGWSDQGLAFDVAVHVGSLVAVLAYFHRDIRMITRDWFRSLLSGRPSGDSRLGWGVLAGTIPAGVAGLLVNDTVDALRSPTVIAWATIGFALVLWWADRRGNQVRDEHTLSWLDVALIGTAQVAALVPGASRSGVTMTAGLLLGLTRAGAARFSFLLAVPLIMAAGSLKLVEAWSSGVSADWPALTSGALIAALVAYACIHGFLKLVNRVGMLPFVLYRLVLGWVILSAIA